MWFSIALADSLSKKKKKEIAVSGAAQSSVVVMGHMWLWTTGDMASPNCTGT